MGRNRRTRGFSLIELLIVVGILGALAALIMPAFDDAGEDAKATVARAEMRRIRERFQQLHADLLDGMRARDGSPAEPTNHYLQDIAWYGLWPLLVPDHPCRPGQAAWPAAVTPASGFKRFDLRGSVADGEALAFGWRGPYLEHEGVVAIETPDLLYRFSADPDGRTAAIARKGGQTRAPTGADSALRIPVVKDPYGGYYRVLCPEARPAPDGNGLDEYRRLHRMALVCTGRNRRLETATDSFIPADDPEYVKAINGDDLRAGGDDLVLRLLPAAF